MQKLKITQDWSYTSSVPHVFIACFFLITYGLFISAPPPLAPHGTTATRGSQGLLIIQKLHDHKGTAVTQWLRCCGTNREVAGLIPAGVSGFFIDIKSFRSHYVLGVDSVSNKNEYQEHFLAVKAVGV